MEPRKHRISGPVATSGPRYCRNGYFRAPRCSPCLASSKGSLSRSASTEAGTQGRAIGITSRAATGRFLICRQGDSYLETAHGEPLWRKALRRRLSLVATSGGRPAMHGQGFNNSAASERMDGSLFLRNHPCFDPTGARHARALRHLAARLHSMPYSPRYHAETLHATLGKSFFDEVSAARFPKHILRYRKPTRRRAGGARHTHRSPSGSPISVVSEPLPGAFMKPLALRYHGHQFPLPTTPISGGRSRLSFRTTARRRGWTAT